MTTNNAQIDAQPGAQLSAELHAATEAFAENLLAAQPFVDYRKAEMRLNRNQQARSLLEQLQTCQADLRIKQSSGQITRSDIEKLQTLQSDAMADQTITKYADSQQGAIAYLREINGAISQLLGTDFAALAKRSCC